MKLKLSILYFITGMNKSVANYIEWIQDISEGNEGTLWTFFANLKLKSPNQNC